MEDTLSKSHKFALGFEHNEDGSVNLKKACVKKRYRPYFRHVHGNSWHSDHVSFFLNFYLGCHPITSLFVISSGLFGLFYLIRWKRNNRERIDWIKSQSVTVTAWIFLLFSLIFSSDIIAWWESAHCES